MNTFPLGSNEVVFECTRLKGYPDKEGVLKPDSEGCYTQVIGGLNAYNSTGDFYEYEAGVSFFQNMSSFQRKIGRGVLRAEYGHPKPDPQMNLEQYGKRLMQIEETRVCGTWTKIWLSKEKLQDEKGRDIIPIMGTIRPYGPFGDALKRGFETKGEQVCFSIRSFTNDTPSRYGGKIKRLMDIVTFDYVNEPGIRNAEKLLSPTLESLVEEVIDPKGLLSIIEETKTKVSSLEESYNSDFEDRLKELVLKESKDPSNLFTLW